MRPVRPQPEPAGVSLTSRDEQVLAALASRVRMLAIEQIAATWWSESADPTRYAAKRMRALEQGGYADRFQANAHPMLTLDAPVLAWNPGDEQPDFGAAGYRLKSRWTRAPRTVAVYAASRLYARRVAGYGGRIKRPLQATHDLHVAAIYLRLLRTAPALAAAWVGEEGLAPDRKDEKLPDAVLVDPEGRPRLVVEFGGAYDADRVRAFHADCEARSLSYQLW